MGSLEAGLALCLITTSGGVLMSCGSSYRPDGDDYASSVSVQVHDRTQTILIVSWTQTIEAESTWLEFTFENDEVLTSRPRPGTAGAHEDVVLGVPAETDVTIRIVSRDAGTDYATRDYMGRTGTLPAGLPRPEVIAYDPARASPERYMFAAVEDSLGGCGAPCYNQWTHWIYIMDRQGRMVWYYADGASSSTTFCQRVARDGDYVWIPKRPFGGVGSAGVVKMTLDGKHFEEIPLPISDCIDVTDDGSVLFDTTAGVLSERDRLGSVRQIWSCPAHFGPAFYCYSNTVNWSAASNTIFLSFPEENTVVEIDRASGSLVAQYGDAPGSYAFSPATWKFEYQHFPNLTPEGTLIVSSHLPGHSDTYQPVAGQHAFVEFAVDRSSRTLIERWVYTSGPEWPMYKGMAVRLANGNTLANYGSGGTIREITPDKQTVFHVKFDVPEGDDFYNKMVGHNELVADLYALNAAPD
jgi:hypothetical protein